MGYNPPRPLPRRTQRIRRRAYREDERVLSVGHHRQARPERLGDARARRRGQLEHQREATMMDDTSHTGTAKRILTA